jgi:WD40 repeat protein
LSGAASAFATRRDVPSAATTQPAQLSPPATAMLQQSLLFSGHQQTVRAIAWSPDGTSVASGADDASLLLWSPDGQVYQRVLHPASVTVLAWSPTGQKLASGSGQSIRFFDGHIAAPLEDARRIHTAQVTSLAWSPSVGYPLVSGSLDRQAIVWDTQGYQPQAIFTRHTAAIHALACRPNGTAVASASLGGVVRIWRVDTLQELHGFYQDSQLPMSALAFAPTSNQLAVGGNDGLLRLWENGLVCQQSSVTTQETMCVDVPLRFRAHTAPIGCVRTENRGNKQNVLATSLPNPLS